VLVTILFLLFSSAYNYMTPATTPAILHSLDGGAANPDEPAHMLYVESIASGHIPVFSSKNGDYEAHQPPLYYIIAACADKLAPSDPDKAVHVDRWAATLLAVALIWVTFFVVREVLPDRPNIAAATAAIVALIPMNLSLGSSVGNDTAANLVFALYLLVVERYFRRPEKHILYGVLLAIVLGAGVWTKSSTLLLFPLTLAALVCASALRLIPTKAAAVSGLIAFAGSAALSLPWLLRNQRLYGDLLAEKVIFHDLASRNVAPSALIGALGQTWYIERFFAWTFASYWGVFDSMNLFLPTNVYVCIAVVSIPVLIWGSIALAKTRTTVLERASLLQWVLLVLLTVFAYVQYNVHFFQVQGRYLYPALIPLTAAAVYGLAEITPKRYAQWVAAALIGSLVLLNLLSLTMISGRYSL